MKLAKRLSMVVGVETVEDWNFIALLGVDQAQGYSLSRQLPAEAVPDWRPSGGDERAEGQGALRRSGIVNS